MKNIIDDIIAAATPDRKGRLLPPYRLPGVKLDYIVILAKDIIDGNRLVSHAQIRKYNDALPPGDYEWACIVIYLKGTLKENPEVIIVAGSGRIDKSRLEQYAAHKLLIPNWDWDKMSTQSADTMLPDPIIGECDDYGHRLYIRTTMDDFSEHLLRAMARYF